MSAEERMRNMVDTTNADLSERYTGDIPTRLSEDTREPYPLPETDSRDVAEGTQFEILLRNN